MEGEVRPPVTGPDGTGKTSLMRILKESSTPNGGRLTPTGGSGTCARSGHRGPPARRAGRSRARPQLAVDPFAQPGIRPDAGSSAVHRS